jgi:transcriptional regulator with XRE-family HTH domain
MEIKMNLAERLKFFRESLGLTQEEFAKKLNTTQAVISNYERGARVPTADFLNRLTEIFHLDINWLLTGEGPMFVGGSKVVDIKDVPKEQIKEFIEEFWQKADEKERIWFEVQFKRAFPEYTDWLQKKQLSQTDQDIKDSQGTLQTNGLNV